jgi:hypothetical protein
VYRAALQQFEELFESASDAGPASRPLPLFYALSQAGRAIAAARADGDDWDFHGHGLKLSQDQDLLHRVVSPRGEGAFGVVRRATGSSPLAQPVEVGALWSSLPDLADTSLPDSEWPAALYFWPQGLVGQRGLIERAGPIKAAVPLGWEGEAALLEVLSKYPTAKGVTLDSPQGVQPITVATPRGHGLLLSWSAYDEQGQRVREFDDVAPVYRFQGERWLRPALGSKRATLSPLMTWWALLYALSIFARYEPAAWVAALDLNESPVAVHLADALDEALTVVPHLVLEALLATPHFSWRPVPSAAV